MTIDDRPTYICLASRSPRRHALLSQIGVAFEPIDVDVDETVAAGEAPWAYVTRVALTKARAGLDTLHPHHILPVLGADTCVVFDGHILGKPADETRARMMLTGLSGNTHEVLSAVAMLDNHRFEVLVSSTRVTFRTLSENEIDAYIATGEPLDKAGGYGIQGLAGGFVQKLEGSYSGVMGLPLFETTELMHLFGIPWLAARPGRA